MIAQDKRKNAINVAVGIITNAQGHYLVALRLAHQSQGNLWEFPGGKIESGESVYEGLCRELREEIGIEVISAAPLLQTRYAYAEVAILLHVWRVTAYRGIVQGLEGQPIAWVSLAELQTLHFPAANLSIVDYLKKNDAAHP